MAELYVKGFVAIDDVTCTVDTGKAILVEIDGDEHWIPQSQIHDDSDVYAKNGHGVLVVSEFIARKRGLWED